MTKIDKPVVQCDRCKKATDDSDQMKEFKNLTCELGDWDLCPDCWTTFVQFMGITTA